MSSEIAAESAPLADSALAEHERLVERDLRRNVTGIVGWEFTWGLGMPFAMFATFCPAYLGELNAPKIIIGLVLAFPTIFTTLQLLPGYFLPPQKRMRRYRAAVVLGVVPYFLYGVCAAFWGAAWPVSLHVALFFLAMLLFLGVLNGAVGIYWEVMTDNIPPRQRGWLFGLRNAGFGSAGLASGLVALWVLRHWPKPLNFRISFIIGTSLYLASCAFLWLVRDHVNPLHNRPLRAEEGPLFGYVAGAMRRVWSDANYRSFIFFYALLASAAAGAPFMVDAAREELGATATGQGTFSLVFMGAAAAFGWMIGGVADRHGYRLVGCLCSVLLMLAFLLCLIAPYMLFWYVAYGCYTLAATSLGMLLCNMSAEIHPDIPPGRLIGVGNLLVVGFVLIANLLSGAVAGWAGSYRPVFIANLVFSILALLGFLLIVREPRGEHPKNVKISPHT